MTPAGEQPLETILYRLDDIEKRRAEDRRHFDASVAELKGDVRSSIASIAYVSREQFGDFRATQAERDKETRDIATDARATARAALWVLIVAVVGAVVALAFQVAA
jgi:DNA-binding ferritin-like protein